jgi:hypothetical protein
MPEVLPALRIAHVDQGLADTPQTLAAMENGEFGMRAENASRPGDPSLARARELAAHLSGQRSDTKK